MHSLSCLSACKREQSTAVGRSESQSTAGRHTVNAVPLCMNTSSSEQWTKLSQNE